MNPEIQEYNNKLEANDKAICDTLVNYGTVIRFGFSMATPLRVIAKKKEAFY